MVQDFFLYKSDYPHSILFFYAWNVFGVGLAVTFIAAKVCIHLIEACGGPSVKLEKEHQCVDALRKNGPTNGTCMTADWKKPNHIELSRVEH